MCFIKFYENIQSSLPELEKEALKFSRQQQKILDNWKTTTGTLDKLERMEQKLNDLILNNDRKGVRQLLEAYLPWTVMEPVEANTWKTWLEAIENPDWSKTTVAFRGVKYDTDKIQRRQTPQGEVYGFMSTVLTKNQGNYTRRLRSLATNREKNGDFGSKIRKEKIQTVKITDQMATHATDPVASNFLSFTYDLGIANSFNGGVRGTQPLGGILVVKMDSRRLVPNLTTAFTFEMELLAPLIIFPDEVVIYEEGVIKDVSHLMIEISEKTGIKSFSNAAFGDQHRNDGFGFLKKMIDIKISVGKCQGIFFMRDFCPTINCAWLTPLQASDKIRF